MVRVRVRVGSTFGRLQGRLRPLFGRLRGQAEANGRRWPRRRPNINLTLTLTLTLGVNPHRTLETLANIVLAPVGLGVRLGLGAQNQKNPELKICF